MDEYFKYVTHSQDDEAWGMYLSVVGFAKILPGSQYPPAGHPAEYFFSWEKGRILPEYQINYITEGEGVIETLNGSYEVREGSILIIRPHTWHRYKPLKNKGWKEHYIGFFGDFPQKIFNNPLYSNELPIISIGHHENIIQAFYDILNYIKDEKPGYQQICSGLVIYILGTMLSIKKNENYHNRRIEVYIQKACLKIRESLNKNINIQELAADFDISYSLFRKEFKNYTGLSPVQYHLALRIQQAMYLLANTDMNVKEISFNLGFCSEYYFSKLFKEKTGKTPSAYYKSSKNNLKNYETEKIY